MTARSDLTQEELAEEIGVAVNTLKHWRSRGSRTKGPAFYRVHRRKVMYTRRAVDDWKRQNTVTLGA